MALPIRPTPELKGSDAARFREAMDKVAERRESPDDYKRAMELLRRAKQKEQRA